MANQECEKKGYKIEATDWRPGHNPKQYISLALKQEGEHQVNVGYVHLVHLRDGIDRSFRMLIVEKLLEQLMK